MGFWLRTGGALLIALTGALPAFACERGPDFCIVDRSVTDRLDFDQNVIGEGEPLAMTRGMGAAPRDDGMVEVFAVDANGCRIRGGTAFLMYPEVFAFEPVVRGSSLAGTTTAGASYGSGGGGGRICE